MKTQKWYQRKLVHSLLCLIVQLGDGLWLSNMSLSSSVHLKDCGASHKRIDCQTKYVRYSDMKCAGLSKSHLAQTVDANYI